MTECSHCRKRYENGVRFCPVDGYAVVPVAEPMLGRTLMGQFQIHSVCGHGATGTVYRATQVGIDREVAVKLLRADLLKDPDVVKRFIREARAGARLNHPNIATVHMVGQSDEGVPFLVMEFVEGVPLSAILGVGKPLPLRRIVHIGAQIASALGEAHGQSIVHRDLKPENILLTERRGEADVVKVVDFGIAKMIAHAAPGEDPISRMGTVFGTPHYIAPEQAAGQAVDGRADIYSLGCILFQMATGRVPFDGQQGLQVLLRQVRDPVPDPRSLNPRMSPALGELILKMLAKDPAARPQSAALAATALRELQADDPGPQASGAPSGGPPRSGSPGRRSEAPRSAPAAMPAAITESPSEPAESNWYKRDEEGDEDEEAAAADAAVDEAPVRRRRPRPNRRPSRSGRPSQASPDGDRDGDGDIEDFSTRSRGRESASFWQRHWMPVVSIGSAIALGAMAGLLYAHYHAVQPVPPPAPPPPVLAAPIPAAPAKSLVRSSSPSHPQNAVRPVAAVSTPGKPAEQNLPVTVFPAGPPLTGPHPLGPGLISPPAPGANPLGASAAPGAPLLPAIGGSPAAAAPAPAAVPAAVPPTPAAVPPTPAPAAAPAPPAPPAAAVPPTPAPAAAPPAPAPAPPAEKAAAPAPTSPPAPPAPAAKTEEPSSPPPASAKANEETDDNGNDPYHRLK